MRIALGQLWQETNTFNPLPTTRADFEEFGVTRGQQMLDAMADSNELGGFIHSLRAWPETPQLLGLVRLPAWPSGLITAETFAWLREETLAALAAAGPVDAVLLALHGAMAADQHPDIEGEILAAIRDEVGPDVPIVATLDLHANVTEEMVAAVDAFVTYHCAPHVDVVETGERGAAVLRRILIDGANPSTAFQKIPAAYPAERANTEMAAGLSAELKQELIHLERHPDILCAGLTTVQPWMDIPQFGSSVIVTTNGQPSLAEESCARIANKMWQRRNEYLPELSSIDEAVSGALSVPGGLTVLSDAADATTSGAPGDSVWILEQLLDQAWPNGALVPLVAPDVVVLAEAAGAGSTLAVELGGKRDSRFGKTLEVDVEVKQLFDAAFTMSGHIGKNMAIDMGRSAVLRAADVHIVVTSRSGPHFAPELFAAAGFDPFTASVVVAKSPCGFRAVYEDRAAQIFSVRAPGCAPSDFWTHSYDQIPRPLWPWDEIDAWQAKPVASG